MRWWRAFGWAVTVVVSLSVLASLAWAVASATPLHIAAAIAFFPVIHVALYLGYRLVKANRAGLMGLVACGASSIPGVVVGWAGYVVLGDLLGGEVGPVANARRVALYGGLAWLTLLTLWFHRMERRAALGADGCHPHDGALDCDGMSEDL